MALQASASVTLWMRDGTDQLIDNAIGIAGAACGIGLSLRIVGCMAGAQDLDPVGNWHCAHDKGITPPTERTQPEP